MSATPYLKLACITKTRGLEGEVMAHVVTGLPFCLYEGLKVWIVPPTEAGTVQFEIESVVPAVKNSENSAYMRLSGVCNIDAAKQFVGRYLLAKRDDLKLVDISAAGKGAGANLSGVSFNCAGSDCAGLNCADPDCVSLDFTGSGSAGSDYADPDFFVSLTKYGFLVPDMFIGREVHDSKHGFLGTVSEYIKTKANDVLVVSGDSGEILIPIVDDAIAEVPMNSSLPIKTHVMEGLIK